MKVSRTLATVATVTSLAMLTVPASAAPAVQVDPGVTAAYAMFDRTTGRTTRAHNEHKQIRSASIVKILIALDYLEKRGPDAEIPQADLVRLVPMLRSSDDNAASELWVQEGWEQIVVRMVNKIGLQDTAPPVNVGFWGYTAVSASDIVKIYRYLLDVAHPRYRDFIMGNLHQATHCATDGFDQSFGLPSVIKGSLAFKQGWSGFGATPPRPCVEPQRVRTGIGAAKEGPVGPGARSAADIDLTSAALHTSGTYGTSDRKIMVVLTLQPKGTGWDVAAERVTRLTRILDSIDRGDWAGGRP